MGDAVRLAAGFHGDDSLCLGSAGDRRVGRLERDDNDAQPFKVSCGGRESWYREAEVERGACDAPCFQCLNGADWACYIPGEVY